MDQLVESFAVLIVTMGPLDNAALFASLTAKGSNSYRFKMATKACLIAALLMTTFMVVGDDVLRYLGIHLSSLKIGGGLLLLIFAIKIVMKEPELETAKTADEGDEVDLPDISVFPMATPMITGPATIVAGILVVSRASGDIPLQAGMIGIALGCIFITYLALLGSGLITRLIGRQGMDVISRVLAIILVALAVEFIVTGLGQTDTFKLLLSALKH